MPDARAGIQFDVMRTPEQLEGLRLEWTELLTHCRIASPFLTWEWMAEWWKSYCADDQRRSLAVVVARRAGQVVAILPGYVRRDALTATFMFLGTEYESTDYLELIEDRQSEETLLEPMLAAMLEKVHGIDIIHLTNILDSTRLPGDLRQYSRANAVLHDVEVHRTCPYVAVVGTWDDYFEALGPKMRKNLRRYERQLTEAGAIFEMVTDRAAVRPAVKTLFDLHALRFAAKEEKTGFRAEQRLPFHMAVAERFFDANILRIFVFRVGDRTIASLYCFEHGGELFYFQSGIDPEWDRFSIGTVLIGKVVNYAFDNQLTRFDFMRGTEEYKFRWTDKVRDILAIRTAISSKGRATLGIRRGFLRTKAIIKKAVRRG